MRAQVIYDSNTTKVTPISNLTCRLSYTVPAADLAAKVGLPVEGNLVSILTEIPEITVESVWGEGATAHLSSVLDVITDRQSTINSVMQLFAGDGYITTPKTNAYTQTVMKEGGVLKAVLKFRIFADSYNVRYRMNTSSYEDWIRCLAKAVTPVQEYSFNAAATNVKTAVESALVGDARETIGQVGTSLLSAGKNVVKAFIPAEISDYDDPATTYLAKSINGLRDAAMVIDDAITNGDKRGGFTFLLGIGPQLTATSSSEVKYRSGIVGTALINKIQSVDWIVQGFTAQPSANFFPSTHGPKPAYVDFTVNVETNQVLTRDQILGVLGLNENVQVLKEKAANIAAKS